MFGKWKQKSICWVFFIQNEKPTSYMQHYLQAKHYYTKKTIPRGAIADSPGAITYKA